jgi:hypothetical protein
MLACPVYGENCQNNTVQGREQLFITWKVGDHASIVG